MGVFVRVGESAGVSVSVGDGVNVGCETVADADSVSEASGVGCTDWVNAAKVEVTLVLPASAGDPVGFPLSGKLQAHKTDTDRIVEIMANRLFIDMPPLTWDKYSFLHKSLNLLLSNYSQMTGFWFRYFRSTL